GTEIITRVSVGCPVNPAVAVRAQQDQILGIVGQSLCLERTMPSIGSWTPGAGRHDVCYIALLHWLAHAVIVSQIEAAHLAMAGGPNPDQLFDLPVGGIAKGP